MAETLTPKAVTDARRRLAQVKALLAKTKDPAQRALLAKEARKAEDALARGQGRPTAGEKAKAAKAAKDKAAAARLRARTINQQIAEAKRYAAEEAAAGNPEGAASWRAEAARLERQVVSKKPAAKKPAPLAGAGPLQPGQTRTATAKAPAPPGRRSAPVVGPAPATSGSGVPAGAGGTTAAPTGGTASTALTAPTPEDIERQAREKYGYMAWALDEPELGKVLRQAALEGWDENRLRGEVFKTNWFKIHGTANVAAGLDKAAKDYLIPLSDQAQRDWAFKIITGEVQASEYENYLKEQAKSLRPWLSGAIDRGITVRQYAEPYVQIAAQTLGLAPEAVDFADPKWSQALDNVRDDGTRAPMNLAEWQTKLRTDSTFGWNFTPQARSEATQFAMKLQETFGAA